MNDIEKAIEFAEKYIKICKKLEIWNKKYHTEKETTLPQWETILQALQEKAERDNPKPLTAKEIKAIKRPIPLYKIMHSPVNCSQTILRNISGLIMNGGTYAVALRSKANCILEKWTHKQRKRLRNNVDCISERAKGGGE